MDDHFIAKHSFATTGGEQLCDASHTACMIMNSQIEHPRSSAGHSHGLPSVCLIIHPASWGCRISAVKNHSIGCILG